MPFALAAQDGAADVGNAEQLTKGPLTGRGRNTGKMGSDDLCICSIT